MATMRRGLCAAGTGQAICKRTVEVGVYVRVFVCAAAQRCACAE